MTAPQTLFADALAVVGQEQPDWLDDVATDGDVNGLHARGLRQAGASTSLYVGAWALLPAREHPNRERVVQAYNPTLGGLNWDDDVLSVAVAAGERVQMWTRWRPRDAELALLDALKRMWHVKAIRLTGASLAGLRQVNLSALAPWLISHRQVILATRVTGNALSEVEEPLTLHTYGTAAVAGDYDAVTLDLQGDGAYESTDTLVVYAWSRWYDDDAPTTLGGATTSAVAVRDLWWAWEALYALSRRGFDRDPDLESRAIGELNQYRALFQTEQGYRGFKPVPAWGPSGIPGAPY